MFVMSLPLQGVSGVCCMLSCSGTSGKRDVDIAIPPCHGTHGSSPWMRACDALSTRGERLGSAWLIGQGPSLNRVSASRILGFIHYLRHTEE